MTPEGRVKNLICSYLAVKYKEIYFWVNDSVGIFDPIRKVYRQSNSPYKKKGVPDILGVLPGGKILAIEVKIPQVKTPSGQILQNKSYPSKEQTAFIEHVTAMGGKAFIARSLEDVKAALGDIA